jgi:hypothetical protein
MLISLQIKEIVNRPVFEKSGESFNILKIVWKAWTESELS